MLGFKSWLKEEERKKNVEDLVGHSLNENIYDDYDELKRRWGHLSPSTRASIAKDMKKLEKLLRTHNWNWQYEKDDTKYKKGRDQEQEIRNIIVNSLEEDVPDAFDLYKKYAKKNGVKVKYFESVEESKGAKITHNLDQLEKMLRKANHHYQHSDNIREYEKGQKEQDEIKHFIKKVGKPAVYFYNRWMKNQGLQDKGFLEFELTDSIRISEDLDKKLNPKLKELEKLLKSADWYYMYSDDHKAYLKGEKQIKDIRDLVKKLGKSGMNFYQDYLKKNGLSESTNQREKVLRKRNILQYATI
jgi:hypothetical protein